MSENKEKDAKANEKTERKDKKDPLKIRISLFFDGTNNNRDNIEEREKDSDIYKKYRKADGSGSYDNGRTNIAIMEPYVSVKKAHYVPDYDFVYKHYIAGQGPVSRGADQKIRGIGLAVGETGVPSRAEEGINLAVSSIFNDNKKINPLTHYIEKLSIDVFGFSRGAATARYAIHVILNGKIAGEDEDTGEVYYEWRPVFLRLNNFFEIEESAVEVKFAGLYDTVLSYVGLQKVSGLYDTVLSYFGSEKTASKNLANVLQQKAVARAKKAFHLAAADEHRADFPLHKISSAIAEGKGEEYYLPGVHSDVGGSYNKANELKLKNNKIPEKDKVYTTLSHENYLVINKALDVKKLKEIEADRNELIAQGWFKSDEIILDTLYSNQDPFNERPLGYQLMIRREGIRNAYSYIPLKIMAGRARKPDVKLKISPELEKRANRILKDESDLKKLETTIKNYMASTGPGNSKPGDWIDDGAKLNTPELKAIRNKHFHFSSMVSIGLHPRFEYDDKVKRERRRRYYYEA